MTEGRSYVRLNDTQNRITARYKKGTRKGYHVGFKCLRNYYTVIKGHTTYIGGIPSHGKCLGKGTKIMMADASLKKVEDVIEGDKLMGINGQERTVLSTNIGHGQMYLIKQNHGIDYRVNDEHILSLKRKTTHKKIKRGDVRNVSVKDYLKIGKTYQQVWKGYKEIAEFKWQDLNIDPYYMGLWLGDGRKDDVAITNIDPEIIEFLRQYADVLNGRLSEYKSKNRVSSWAIVEAGMKNKLRDYGVLNNKHIPKEFINNNKKVRLRILAGLIDSDGSLNTTKSNYEVTFKSKRLAEDLKYLCDTLGLRTSINPKIARIKSIGYECEVWRVIIGGEIHKIPVQIERKKVGTKRHLFTGIQVIEDGTDDYYGFELDGDKLFLLEDGTVTHNTEFTWELLMNLTNFYGWKHAIFSSETGEPEDIAIEIVKKHQRAQFDPRYNQRMEESAAYEALNEMSEHFFIIDDPVTADKEYTPEQIMDTATEIMDAEGGLDTLVIDPWNELRHDFSIHGGRQDKYLEYILGKIRRFARKMKLHVFVIAHPKTLQRTKEGIYLPPSAFELSGGASWYAKGEAILCIHRPFKMDDGSLNSNMANIIIQKAKPKEVGYKGSVELFYDVAKGRYYEKDDVGMESYAKEITTEEDALDLGKEGAIDVPF